MKKWEKCYIVIDLIILVILCVGYIIFRHNISCFSKTEVGIIETIFHLILLLAMVSILVFLAIHVILIIKQGLHNIRGCDDELFGQLDEYKEGWNEDKRFYIKQIQIINLFYKKDGKVEELVNNNEIERLYARADFLSTQSSFYADFLTCFYSLTISVIASFVCQMMEYKSLLLQITWLFVIVLSFFCILLLRYVERGQAGSYRHYIDQYETKLLLEKIDKVERKFIITTDDEQIMRTQQVVINELIAIRKKKKAKTQKEKLDADIRRVEQLDLCIGDYSQCYIQKVFINGSVGYLVYNRKEGQENNYIGELNLINQQHSILYQIMNKYELISYYG